MTESFLSSLRYMYCHVVQLYLQGCLIALVQFPHFARGSQKRKWFLSIQVRTLNRSQLNCSDKTFLLSYQQDFSINATKLSQDNTSLSWSVRKKLLFMLPMLQLKARPNHEWSFHLKKGHLREGGKTISKKRLAIPQIPHIQGRRFQRERHVHHYFTIGVSARRVLLTDRGLSARHLNNCYFAFQKNNIQYTTI